MKETAPRSARSGVARGSVDGVRGMDGGVPALDQPVLAAHGAEIRRVVTMSRSAGRCMQDHRMKSSDIFVA
jgi:hypothetical protein